MYDLCGVDVFLQNFPRRRRGRVRNQEARKRIFIDVRFLSRIDWVGTEIESHRNRLEFAGRRSRGVQAKAALCDCDCAYGEVL